MLQRKVSLYCYERRPLNCKFFQIFFFSILEATLQLELIETVLKECDRGNIAYKTIALESLGKILMSSNRDYFAQVYEKVKSIISDVRVKIFVFFSKHPTTCTILRNLFDTDFRRVRYS